MTANSREEPLTRNEWSRSSLTDDEMASFMDRLGRYGLAKCIQSVDRTARYHFASTQVDPVVTILSGRPIRLPPAVTAVRSLMWALDIGYKVRDKYLSTLGNTHEYIAVLSGELPKPKDVLELDQTRDIRRYYDAGLGAYGVGYATLNAADIKGDPASFRLGFAQPEVGELTEIALDLTVPRQRYALLDLPSEFPHYRGEL